MKLSIANSEKYLELEIQAVGPPVSLYILYFPLIK